MGEKDNQGADGTDANWTGPVATRFETCAVLSMMCSLHVD
jgi:hypothetical protein